MATHLESIYLVEKKNWKDGIGMDTIDFPDYDEWFTSLEKMYQAEKENADAYQAHANDIMAIGVVPPYPTNFPSFEEWTGEKELEQNSTEVTHDKTANMDTGLLTPTPKLSIFDNEPSENWIVRCPPGFSFHADNEIHVNHDTSDLELYNILNDAGYLRQYGFGELDFDGDEFEIFIKNSTKTVLVIMTNT